MEVHKNVNRSAIILYGTETGTSQDIAEEVGRCLERLRFAVDVVGFDKVAFSLLSSYTLTVFVIATTGQGDFPSNSRKFWTSLLRKKLGPSTFSELEYALVGLGDSSYLKFNWAAKKLDKRLRQLGAEEICEACEADEQADEGIDGAFLAWLRGFRKTVWVKYPLPNAADEVLDSEDLPSKWILRDVNGLVSKQNGTLTVTNGNTNGYAERSDSFDVVLEENKRVTPDSHWQDVRFLQLRASEVHDYLPGDALAITPENMSQDVEGVLAQLGWQDMADKPLAIVSNKAQQRQSPLFHLSAPLDLHGGTATLRHLLTKHLDIHAIPRRSFFTQIARYTSDSMHKERLLEFTDPQYLDEYYDYATRPRRSIVETLQEFDSVRIPWQEAINIFPILRPRQFSIASGGRLKGHGDGTVFKLLVAIVKYRTVIKRVREGLCTRYLAQLPVGTKLQVELKCEGRFASRADLATKSYLLIGAGTGIAPLRSLIHEKAQLSDPSPSSTLIFGARNAAADYFFSDEWESFSAEGKLEVYTAFSRDQKDKVYVQDRIRTEGQLVSRILHDTNSVVIVCGASGQMPKAVRQALVDVLVGAPKRSLDGSPDEVDRSLGMTVEEAEQFLSRMEKEGRHKQETWS